jgi:dipeptidase E
VAERQILALGGHAMRPGDPLDDFLLELTGASRPRVLLIPTASAESADYVVRFHETYGRRAEPSHLSLFGIPPRDIRSIVLDQDAIFVGGGNTANMLAIWRVHGVDRFLREAWEAGVVLAGLSAGSMCWFEWGVTTSSGAPAPSDGLGFLPGSNSVHHDSEPARRPVYLEAVRTGAIPPGYAVDDGAALIFSDHRLEDVVTARKFARAYEVTQDGERELSSEALTTSVAASITLPAVAELRQLRIARQRH